MPCATGVFNTLMLDSATANRGRLSDLDVGEGRNRLCLVLVVTK